MNKDNLKAAKMDKENQVKILVVEDDSSSATFLTIALKAIGYQVVGVATSGMRAIEMARELKPTLVLTDIELEGSMDGIEVARYCQKQLHLPVVYLTSHDDGETLARAKVTGSLGYLLKPFIKKELAIALEMALHKHRLEQQLKTQEQWLTAILNSMGEGLIATNLHGQITFMNPMAEKLTEWPVAEAMNQKLELVFKLIDDPHNLLTIFHLFTQESILQSRFGHETPIAINLTPLQDEHNVTIGRLLNFRDITEHKQAEQILKESLSQIEQAKQEWEATADVLPELVCLVDDKQHVIRANRIVEHWGLGQVTQIKGLHIHQLLHGSCKEENCLLQHCLSRAWQQITLGQPGEGEVDDKILNRYLHIQIRPISRVEREISGLETSHAVVLIRDITESRRLEQQLQLSQKMEAIGRLAGGVAHDFNNILMAIMGDCELMLHDLFIDEELRQNIQHVLENAQRGASLTKQLLAFGRKMVIKPTELDLNVVLINMEKLISRLIGEHIQLVTLVEPNLGRIQADAGQIEQVIMNLAINARDAMPKGGRLTIQTANVNLTEMDLRQNRDFQVGSYIMLTIRDTGTGIAADTLPYIFEPFFTTKGVGQGTGLGLSTVHGVVKQSGGHILVESQLGQGTTFKAYFPRLQNIVATVAPTILPLAVNRNGHETILVVEDEASVRLIVQRLLTKRGYQVITASYGQEAIDLCQQTQPKMDLIITDIMLPHGMTGRELVEQLRPKYPQLKVLFMSGYADDIVNQQDLLRSDVGFLQKPFALTDLTEKVRQLLDQKVT